MEQIAISCYDGREGKTNVLLHYAEWGAIQRNTEGREAKKSKGGSVRNYGLTGCRKYANLNNRTAMFARRCSQHAVFRKSSVDKYKM